MQINHRFYKIFMNPVNIAWPKGMKVMPGCGVRERIMMQRVCGCNVRGVRNDKHERCNDSPHRNKQARRAG